MNLPEAYSILGLPSNSTPADAKKKFRELSKKYHPDNSETGDEAEFKRINHAHQYITKPETREREINHPRSGGDPFNPFVRTRQNVRVIEEIKINTNLSFAESILGCQRKIIYTRKVKCQDCNGDGVSIVKGGCDKCNGLGQITMRHGNVTVLMPCDKCGGRRATKACDSCSATGTVEAETSISVNIPGGVSGNTTLRLGGKGNFVNNMGPWEQYTDAFLVLIVEEDPDIKLINNEVISGLNISLLEAIRGCKKTVRTILGDKEIEVKSLSKNKDEVVIPHVGINGTGPQKVILDVKYPDNTNLLIDALTRI